MDRRAFLKTTSAVGIAAAGATASIAHADTPRTEYRASDTPLPVDIAGDLQFSLSEYERRHTGIRSKTEDQDLDALVVTGNREWVQGELGNLLYLGIERPDWEVMYVVFPREETPIVPSKVGGLTPGESGWYLHDLWRPRSTSICANRYHVLNS